mgnify:CR=1 FL=1
MITVTDLSLNYSGTPLFSHVDLQFLRGNCFSTAWEITAGWRRSMWSSTSLPTAA